MQEEPIRQKSELNVAKGQTKGRKSVLLNASQPKPLPSDRKAAALSSQASVALPQKIISGRRMAMHSCSRVIGRSYGSTCVHLVKEYLVI
jgi:hypothetical protein